MGDEAHIENVKDRRHVRRLVTISLVIMALLLLVLIPLASTYPDGLARAAGDLGFTGSQPMWSGLFPDYKSSVGGGWFGTFFAGIIGAVIVLATILVIGRIMTLRRTK